MKFMEKVLSRLANAVLSAQATASRGCGVLTGKGVTYFARCHIDDQVLDHGITVDFKQQYYSFLDICSLAETKGLEAVVTFLPLRDAEDIYNGAATLVLVKGD